MGVLNIRDVPDEVRDDLAAAARAEGVSLQKYLLRVVLAEARKAHNRALLAAVRATGGGSHRTSEEIADDIGHIRQEREQRIMPEAERDR